MAVAAVAAFGGCARALAAASASAPASITVDQQVAGISVVAPLTLPTVSTASVAPVSTLGSTSGVTSAAISTSAVSTSAISSQVGGNAALTISGQSGDTVSMAVPATFQVIRTGGTEALTVQTNTNAQYDLAGNGVVLGGSAMNADTMSVNIGGSVNLASAGDLVPGPYEGLLVVVVQYN